MGHERRVAGAGECAAYDSRRVSEEETVSLRGGRDVILRCAAPKDLDSISVDLRRGGCRADFNRLARRGLPSPGIGC